MEQVYTAYLTSNKRDKNINSPKVLLTDVTDSNGNELRDHCWVKLSRKISSIQPKNGRNQPIKIMFTAEEKEYQSINYKTSELEMKTGLSHIRNLRKI